MAYTVKQIKQIEKLDCIDVEQRYDDMLDECNEVVNICGMEYNPSRVLKDVDPTAYRCGLSDFIDSEQQSGVFSDEVNGEYYDYSEVQDILDNEEEA